jgi:hypothetical protein
MASRFSSTFKALPHASAALVVTVWSLVGDPGDAHPLFEIVDILDIFRFVAFGRVLPLMVWWVLMVVWEGR